MKKWIAISLSDFHSSSKRWQRGDIDNVKVVIIGSKTLEGAKMVATTFNDDAWMVFPLGRTKNIAYAKTLEKEDGSL